MTKRNVLNSPRLLKLKKQRRRIVLGKILILFFGLGTIFSLLIYLSRFNSLNIGEIQIVGNKAVDTEMINEVVKQEIAGYYFWFFPKTNFLIYPQHKIATELKNKFKTIKDIFINDKNMKILVVSLTEREAKYTWFGKTWPEMGVETPKCYFTDRDGYIFNEAPYFSGEVYFKLYGQINGETALGSYFSENNFPRLILFKKMLEALKLKPAALSIMADGNAKIFLSEKNASGTGPEIIFKLDFDFKKIAENLETAFKTESLRSKFESKYSALKYIDLRFDNKIYY